MRGFGGGRAPKARAESRRRRRRGQWDVGRGVPSPTGEGPGEEALPLPRNFFFDFWSPNSDFLCIMRAIFYGSVDCFGRRQPLHDSIGLMSVTVTGVIAGS